MYYVIETTMANGQWTTEGIGQPNQFTSRSSATKAIRQLRALGEDWATAAYRIVELPPSPIGETTMTRHTADIPQTHGQGQTIPGLLHAGYYAERRRNVVLVCDPDRVLPHYDIAEDDAQVTCKKCLTILKKQGQDA